MTKFGMLTHGKGVFQGLNHAPILGTERMCRQYFWDLLHMPTTCLGGSGDWDTVCTNRDGLSEEPGFNSWVGR